ncbi:putative Fcf2 pre-rRNA processing [Helianthus annuus]|nr:putative Fcf2 pre-rRNA processing [Helianthus annuus]KAJ0709852.1 putative Fcf2 pre-rRNA processing [Helianthus annuus]
MVPYVSFLLRRYQWFPFCVLQLRNVIDPKRHYKKGDSKLNTFPKYFQVGTVVEPVSEYFTSRLTKKERKPTLADELLSDKSLKDYM